MTNINDYIISGHFFHDREEHTHTFLISALSEQHAINILSKYQHCKIAISLKQAYWMYYKSNTSYIFIITNIDSNSSNSLTTGNVKVLQ